MTVPYTQPIYQFSVCPGNYRLCFASLLQPNLKKLFHAPRYRKLLKNLSLGVTKNRNVELGDILSLDFLVDS